MSLRAFDIELWLDWGHGDTNLVLGNEWLYAVSALSIGWNLN